MSIRRNILIAFIFILVGSLVYVLFRPNIIFFNLIGASDCLASIKLETQGNSSFWYYFFLYCFSDVLWYAALLILASTFYVREVLLSRILFSIMVIMPFGLELMQEAELIPGTFDWYDILFYFITLIIFVLLWIRKSNCLLLHN